MGAINPLDHYRQHSAMYDYIQRRVEAVSDYFAQASRDRQKWLLNRAVSFALISTETRVDLHERGYLNLIGVTDVTENAVQDALLSAGVNYYKNKSRYILHNFDEPDYDRVLDLYDQGDLDGMHRAIADEFLGVGLTKSAFAMANAVTPQKMCVDRHVARLAGIDPDDVYEGIVVDRYERQCARVMAQWPELAHELPPYIFQWVVFDADQDTVTTHDPWFMTLPQEALSEI